VLKQRLTALMRVNISRILEIAIKIHPEYWLDGLPDPLELPKPYSLEQKSATSTGTRFHRENTDNEWRLKMPV
jgi:hypothetical protein